MHIIIHVFISYLFIMWVLNVLFLGLNFFNLDFSAECRFLLFYILPEPFFLLTLLSLLCPDWWSLVYFYHKVYSQLYVLVLCYILVVFCVKDMALCAGNTDASTAPICIWFVYSTQKQCCEPCLCSCWLWIDVVLQS